MTPAPHNPDTREKLPICERLRNDAVCQNRTNGADPLCTEAADTIEALVEALGECQDKLWVLHFSLRDEAERGAAINACNMANAALSRARANPEEKPK